MTWLPSIPTAIFLNFIEWTNNSLPWSHLPTVIFLRHPQFKNALLHALSSLYFLNSSLSLSLRVSANRENKNRENKKNKNMKHSTTSSIRNLLSKSLSSKHKTNLKIPKCQQRKRSSTPP
ncbi:hypothetical protein Patl1_04028 [Pistacia atlantica]|uniref:Uncharacterized protein n=1 Tax=Pistacia atlantica TaxID=434234 RepID=A0ACC1BXL0_9ROSI|nr:hypothetical protein Patl1_04028 [Pistacia atlantica]